MTVNKEELHIVLCKCVLYLLLIGRQEGSGGDDGADRQLHRRHLHLRGRHVPPRVSVTNIGDNRDITLTGLHALECTCTLMESRTVLGRQRLKTPTTQ